MLKFSPDSPATKERNSLKFFEIQKVHSLTPQMPISICQFSPHHTSQCAASAFKSPLQDAVNLHSFHLTFVATTV